MIPFKKKARYYYWLAESFIKKNIKLLIASFIASFLFIFLTINFFPFISSILFSKKEKIGSVGQYTFQTIPDSLTSIISNSLITIDGKGEIIPILANSWELLNNKKTYRFHLKQNLVWSDGKKFTANDINYHFKGIQTKVIDESTVEFNLNSPLSIFPVYLTKPIIRYPLEGVAGLYQVDTYRIVNGNISSVALTPNKPDIPYKTYFYYDTEDKMITAYKMGEINTFTTSKKSIANTFSSWKNTLITKTVNTNQIMTLFFNYNSPLIGKDLKTVRQAFAYATPKFETMGEEATGPIPPSSWAYVSGLKRYPYNLERAQTLLKGNNATSSAQLNLYTFYDYLNVAEELKKNYDTLGFKININVLSYLPQTFDMILTVWNPPIDPDQYYFWHSTQADGNITNYKNVKVDKLLEDGRSVIDLDQRKSIYAEFQKAIVDDLPAYFIYYPNIYTIVRK